MKTLTLLTTAIASSLVSVLPAYAALTFNSSSPINVAASSLTDAKIFVTGVNGSNAINLSISGSTGDLSGLTIYLQNPALNKTLLLAANLTGSFSNNVKFSDTSILGNIDVNTAPYNGTFLPFNSADDSPNFIANINNFSDFSPANNGDWNLKLINTNPSRVSVGQTSLTFDATPVPFEFNPLTGVSILGGLWFGRKVLRKR